MSFPPVLLDAAAGSHSNCDDDSSCILLLLLCSSICLCQLILSPPILHSLLKGAGSLDHQAFVATHGIMRAPGPSGQAHSVSSSLLGMWSGPPRGSHLSSSLSKPAATSWPCLRARSNICSHNQRWGWASQTYWWSWMPASSSSPCFYLRTLRFAAQQAVIKGDPAIFSPRWMDTRRCAWKISNLTSWLYSTAEMMTC